MGKPIIDVQVQCQGNIWMFTPITEEANGWVDMHVSTEPWQWTGNSFAVDQRYVDNLVFGMQEDGLTVEVL